MLHADNVILIGDFNTASNDDDEKHRGYYSDLITNLNGLTNCAELTGEKYSPTFKGKYTDDFCFISKNLEKYLKKTNIISGETSFFGDQQVNWGEFSDHCPIIVDLDFKQ
jgi:exonuclease III